jgi:hypothetical protein
MMRSYRRIIAFKIGDFERGDDGTLVHVFTNHRVAGEWVHRLKCRSSFWTYRGGEVSEVRPMPTCVACIAALIEEEHDRSQVGAW